MPAPLPASLRVAVPQALEVPDRKCGSAAEAVELFVRSASVLPRRPAVLLMDASPDQNFCDNGHFPALAKRSRG